MPAFTRSQPWPTSAAIRRAKSETRDFTRSRPWPTSAAIKRAKSETSDFAGHDTKMESTVRATRESAESGRCSEIRFLRSRDVRVLIIIIFMPVFGADDFLPLARAAPIGNGRGPRGCEDALILDREVDLQIFAPVVAVDVHRGAEILFCVPFQ